MGRNRSLIDGRSDRLPIDVKSISSYLFSIADIFAKRRRAADEVRRRLSNCVSSADQFVGRSVRVAGVVVAAFAGGAKFCKLRWRARKGAKSNLA